MPAKLKPQRVGGLNTSSPRVIGGIQDADGASTERNALPDTSPVSASARMNTAPASSSAAHSEPPPAPAYVTLDWIDAQLQDALDYAVVGGPLTVLSIRHVDGKIEVVEHELPEQCYYIIARLAGPPPSDGLITVER